jgi:hypothetical protein
MSEQQECVSDVYDDVVSTYISVIKQDSLEAAAAVEEILVSYGSRAALRATLVMTLLKAEAQNNHSVENLSVRRELLNDFPEALPLLERAVACWLLDWGTISFVGSAG